MKVTRPTLFAAGALLMACAAARADSTKYTGNVNSSSIARVEIVAPFQLSQTNTTKVSSSVSSSTYTGQGTLLVSPCGNNLQPYSLTVRLDLRTVTTLNACGDGVTDGQFTLTDITNAASNTSISGTLDAVNTNFGTLQGVVEGVARLPRLHTGGPGGSSNTKLPPLMLRGVFNGTFVKDQNGQYTLVDVTNTHGVLFVQNTGHNGGNGGSGQGGDSDNGGSGNGGSGQGDKDND